MYFALVINQYLLKSMFAYDIFAIRVRFVVTKVVPSHIFANTKRPVPLRLIL